MFDSKLIHIVVFILMGSIYNIINSQTCCSGGVPLSGNVGLPSGDKGTLQVLFTYDDNVLKTLKSATRTLDDDSRTRHTRSFILQTGYNFTNRFSVDVFSSYVIQERLIEQGGTSNKTKTGGIGDLAILGKYKWLTFGTTEHTSLTSAIGVKFPLGASDLTTENGLGINADLQPGSGAWDGVFWTQVIHQLAARQTSSVSGTLIYNQKGINNDYLGVFDYKFGNEIQFHLGIGDRFLIKKIFLDPSLQLQFRNAAKDRQNDFKIPNTGGKWLFLKLSNNLWINENIALHLGGIIPLYSNVDGTQLSPTYRLEIGLYSKFKLKKESINIFN